MGSNGGSLSDEVTSRHEIVMQGTSAELLATEWGLAREALDAYSLESHRRAIAATDEGRFEREIVPIELPAEGDAAAFAVDEAARRDTSLEKPRVRSRRRSKPTASSRPGNSSQIVDGAAAVLIASEAALTPRTALEPRARLVSFGLAGVDPTRMLHGNPEAMRKALDRAGLTLDDIGVIEVNEAFATVVLQTVADLGLEERMADVNPNGGGISLGHPLGATGARITATLAARARAPRRALRDRLDVRRLRHGDRRRRGDAVTVRTIGVVGLGAMGAGIAQLAVEAGFDTVGREVDAPRGEAARDADRPFPDA